MSDRCGSCRAPADWATFAKSGKRALFDPDSVDPGTRGAFVLLGVPGHYTAYPANEAVHRHAMARAVSYPRAEELLIAEGRYRVTHFSTCPDAETHRRRGGASTPPSPPPPATLL